jgi:ketosteroid isomerase-like protein
MAEPDLAQVVRRNYEALAAGDPQPMLDSLAPSFRYSCHTRNRFHGTTDLTGLLTLWGESLAVQDDYRLEVVDVRALPGDLVVAHNRVSFSLDGRNISDADVVSVIVFEDGKVVDSVEVNGAALNQFWQAGGDERDAIR